MSRTSFMSAESTAGCARGVYRDVPIYDTVLQRHTHFYRDGDES